MAGFILAEIDVGNLSYKCQKSSKDLDVKLLEDELLVMIKGCEYNLKVPNYVIDGFIKILKEHKVKYVVISKDNVFTHLVSSSPKGSFTDDLIFLSNSSLSVSTYLSISLKFTSSKYRNSIAQIVKDAKAKGYKLESFENKSEEFMIKELGNVLLSFISGFDYVLSQICRKNNIIYTNNIKGIPESTMWSSVEYTYSNKYGFILIEI